MAKKIEIFTVDYCPYCKKAVEYLKVKGIEFKQIDITQDEDEMREKLGKHYKIEGKVTVPQIIIDGQRLGGYDDLMANPQCVLSDEE